MRRKRGVDKNQPEIVDAARDIPGVTVFDASGVGDGFPDIVVGFRGETYLFEVKTKDGQLRDSQIDFFEKWTGQVEIIRSLDDLLKEIGAI